MVHLLGQYKKRYVGSIDDYYFSAGVLLVLETTVPQISNLYYTFESMNFFAPAGILSRFLVGLYYYLLVTDFSLEALVKQLGLTFYLQ